jgi:uncharacterized protein YggE
MSLGTLKNLAAASFVAAMLTSVSMAQVNALPEHPHILVYGSATARALPDRFDLSLTVKHTDVSADVARERVASLFEEIIDQLQETGVPQKEIQGTSLVIQTIERWDDKLQSERFIGIQVSRDIKARFESNETVERFLKQLETSENVVVGGLEAQLSSEQALRNELRAKAIDDSRSKAASIAESYGVGLGSLYSVSDVAPQFSYGIREGQWPSTYQWSTVGGETLDRIEVSGARVSQDTAAESLHVGYITFESKLYAVFLLGSTRGD